LTDADRPENLWNPLPGDHGAHGDFDARSSSWSPELWATMHPDMGGRGTGRGGGAVGSDHVVVAAAGGFARLS